MEAFSSLSKNMEEHKTTYLSEIGMMDQLITTDEHYGIKPDRIDVAIQDILQGKLFIMLEYINLHNN